MALILSKCAMIHVPKTGGTFCRMALRAVRGQGFESGPAKGKEVTRRVHAALRACYKDLMVEDWRKKDFRPHPRFIFGFVRHPLGWLASSWADIICQHGRRPGDWRGRCFSYNFRDYAEAVVRVKPSAPSLAMLGRLGFCRKDGKWVSEEHRCDFIGKQEYLLRDLMIALRRARQPFDKAVLQAIPRYRVAGQLPKYKRQVVWTSAQIDKLMEANAQLCEMFHYSAPRCR